MGIAKSLIKSAYKKGLAIASPFIFYVLVCKNHYPIICIIRPITADTISPAQRLLGILLR